MKRDTGEPKLDIPRRLSLASRAIERAHVGRILANT